MECRRPMQIFLCLLLFSFVSCHCFAQGIENLYSVVIQVSDNTNTTRGKYLPQAFEEVIKRVSSSQDIINEPEYEKARQHLDRFVSNYFYTENADKTYTLTLRFNEQTINGFLYKLGRQTLGKNRPQVLLWLVMEQHDTVQFVDYISQANVATKIETYSKTYGLPIIFPLLDLTERLFISENDVINYNLPPLQQASDRYNTHTMVLGKMINVGGIWHCEWRLVNGEQNVAWHTSSSKLDDGLEQMVNQVADRLIVHKETLRAPRVNKQGITLRIKGVESVTDYAKILEHIKRMPVVQNVEVGSVDGNRAEFLVTADGGFDELLKNIKLSNMLATDLTPQINVPSNNGLDLIYRISS